MKVYIASRYKGVGGKHEIEQLSKAVRDAGMKDFSFVRDVEHHEQPLKPKELWARAKDEIGACDAFLIDVSDHPSGGRVAEAGIAYAMGKAVITIKRHGVAHKPLYDGISETVITYSDYQDLAKQLKHFDKDRVFNVTDKSLLFLVFVAGGAALSYVLAQVFIPLAIIGPIVYWFVVRHFVSPLRAFDRVIIYVPLIAIWVGGFAWLSTIDSIYSLAWGIMFWVIVLPLLQRGKFAL